MSEPFYEEDFHYFDIEFQNSENVAEMGEFATVKKYACDADKMPELKVIAERALKEGFDSFLVKEVVEKERMFNVDEVLGWTE